MQCAGIFVAVAMMAAAPEWRSVERQGGLAAHWRTAAGWQDPASSGESPAAPSGDGGAASQPTAGKQDPGSGPPTASLPAPTPSGGAAAYDPLAVAGECSRELLLTVRDEQRDREIPLRAYLPPAEGAAPVVLYSHGLGGNLEVATYLGRHWSLRGYVAVFLQHPGSDESLWRGVPLREAMANMRRGASGENLQLRVADVPAVLDRLLEWNGAEGHELKGRLDPERIGMSGHSFGAVTTQAVSGQSFLGSARYTDRRIRAAVIMSPSAPRTGSAERAFQEVRIPWLLMTGTRDVAAIGGISMDERLAVFPALPAGDKYELVLDGAEHSAFTDRPLPGERQGRNPNHHRAILATSTAFWDVYLRGDPAARAWLDDEAALRKVLEPADRWQHK